jgi:DNA-binding MarR family transcriptional regulator
VILDITEEGRRKRREILKQKDDLMFEVLEPDEREQLRGILVRLAEHAAKKDDIDLIDQTEQLKGGHR